MPDDFSHPEEFLGYDQNTIYELLNAKNISWRIYFGDLPQSIVLQRQWKAKNRHNYRIMERFYIDAAGPPDDFPEYVFIEPRYYNSLQLEGPQNDDHPPHPPGPAQELLAAVYNSLRRNEDLWNSTLLVVLYDEHGGFYDHVTPPAAIPPDACNVDGFDFKQLGMRVPAILASPYVGKGVVIKTVFDHTSLLRYLIDKWNLGPLTARSCAANSISAAIMNFPQAHTLESLPLPPPPPVAPQSQVALAMAPLPLNEHQKVLIEFTKLMDRRPMLPLPLNLSPMGAQLVAFEPLSELSAAKRRMAAFLQ
jgi:phospholipase C